MRRGTARRKGFVLEFCSTLGIRFYEAFRKILRSPFAKQLTGLFLLVVQRLRKLSRRGIIKGKSRTNCELGGRHCRLRSNPLLFGCKKGLATKVTSPFLARVRDSFLNFAQRLGSGFMKRFAKFFGHRSQNNSQGCFAHCVRIPCCSGAKKDL